MTPTITNLPDFDFLTAVNRIKNKCVDHMGEWKLPEKDVEKLQVLHEKALLAFTLNKDPAESNATTQAAKNLAFKELKAFISTFIDALVLNENVPDDALEAMGIRSRHREYHRTPPPEEQLNVTYKKKGNFLDVFGGRGTFEHPKRRSTPKNATGGTEWQYYYKKEGENSAQSVRSSTAKYHFEFQSKDRGEIIVVRGRWVNARFQGGPWSDWVEIVIG
jgi:hypothetical protein